MRKKKSVQRIRWAVLSLLVIICITVSAGSLAGQLYSKGKELSSGFTGRREALSKLSGAMESGDFARASAAIEGISPDVYQRIKPAVIADFVDMVASRKVYDICELSSVEEYQEMRALGETAGITGDQEALLALQYLDGVIDLEQYLDYCPSFKVIGTDQFDDFLGQLSKLSTVSNLEKDSGTIREVAQAVQSIWAAEPLDTANVYLSELDSAVQALINSLQTILQGVSANQEALRLSGVESLGKSMEQFQTWLEKIQTAYTDSLVAIGRLPVLPSL